MHSIIWPAEYLPGTTANFASNEEIVAGVDIAKTWQALVDTSAWPGYYENASDVGFHDDSGPVLSAGARFRFTTFGFVVEAEVTEFVSPKNGEPGRLAWHGWVDGDSASRLDVHHAWLLETLPGDRLRVLTQETQTGKPAEDLARTRPNPMINGHQAWLDGLLATARKT